MANVGNMGVHDRGKWGRGRLAKRNFDRAPAPSGCAGRARVVIEMRRSGGTTVTVRDGYIDDRRRSAGVRRQNFFSSPGLRGWFAAHDDYIDYLLLLDEREERRRDEDLRLRLRMKGGR